MIHIDLIISSLPVLLKGLGVSLQIAFLSSCIGISLGTILALIQTSTIRPLTWLVIIFVNIIRGTPMLIQIFFAMYLLPQIGITLAPFWVAIIAIGLNSSAYISQIIRSGIGAINKGQLEAAQVLGLSKIQTIRYIILPQALALVLPGLGNEFITLIKDSSLASLIGVSELTKEGRLIMSRTLDAITIYAVIAVLYLAVTITISCILFKLEERINHAKN